uniref:Uncharacterized protein n=1 Tax=Arundo donax TaxID=35708 RepID=A0A0A9H0P5_ARUDO
MRQQKQSRTAPKQMKARSLFITDPASVPYKEIEQDSARQRRSGLPAAGRAHGGGGPDGKNNGGGLRRVARREGRWRTPRRTAGRPPGVGRSTGDGRISGSRAELRREQIGGERSSRWGEDGAATAGGAAPTRGGATAAGRAAAARDGERPQFPTERRSRSSRLRRAQDEERRRRQVPNEGRTPDGGKAATPCTRRRRRLPTWWQANRGWRRPPQPAA